MSIYLNHAGTSWPKPPQAQRLIEEAIAGDPIEWPSLFAESREKINNFFGITNPSRLLLTPSCTAALSIAIADQAWEPGDQVLTSSFEHHALHRPLFKLTEMGVDLEVLPRTDSEPLILDEMEARLRGGNVKLVAICSASNVTGELLPVEDAIGLAHDYGALVLIDGAQTTGWADLNIPALGADMYCFAGHKGPHAPWGIGGLYVDKDVCLNSLSSKCETVEETSETKWHGCSEMPTFCDAGSANIWAMIGLAAASDWLAEHVRRDRLLECQKLSSMLYDGLAEIEGLTVYGPRDPKLRMPTVAFTHRTILPGDFGRALRQKGIISSYGLQCSPLAHRMLGTGPFGVVRLSCGPLNTMEEIEKTIAAVFEVAKVKK